MFYFLLSNSATEYVHSATEKTRIDRLKKKSSNSATEPVNSATDVDSIRTPISSILSHFHNMFYVIEDNA